LVSGKVKSHKQTKQMDLIIVESPTKAKIITRFLSDDFLVESCNGHIRDLPRGKLGVDPEKNFETQYVIPTTKRKIVNKLKKLGKKADKIYIASDEDREGEAIAWHLDHILESKNTKRISFHEITKEAIEKALKAPREIDINLVNAQQSRRILDRLVGYKLSPLLWKKLVKGLSAGRVQSPAVRLIVEREREIEKFKPQEYWSIEAELKDKKETFWAKLVKKEGKTLDKLEIKTEKGVKEIIKDLEKAEYKIIDIRKKEINKSPRPPFITSTLQQQASGTLGFSVKQTMVIAQQLYEGVSLNKESAAGLITYMRTDSLTLSEKFLKESHLFIKKEYGDKYLEKRIYKTKSKTAQEAHEAIRPTDCQNTPEKMAKHLNKNQLKLYDLIWCRAMASQMSKQILDSTAVDIEAKQYLFRANGLNIKFDGWSKIYPEKQKENYLPGLEINQILELKQLKPDQHFTEPLPRYNEASLVKALEEHGIGRPSTYAPIITAIQTRNYVQKEQKRLKPTDIGILVNDLLVKHFSDIVDYKFTAQLEDDLDKIARGEEDYLKMLNNFYQPFIKNLQMKEEEIEKKFTDEQTDEKCPKCNEPLVIKMGRFGKFLACTGFPKCRHTKSLTDSSGNNHEKIDIPCPKCDGEIVKKRTRKGKFFYGCSSWPKCDFAVWDEPTDEKCPKCKSIMVKKGDQIKCSNKECK